MDWQPYLVSLKLALVTTLLLTLIAVPLAWWIVFGRTTLRKLVHIVGVLPLVLPPTVLGFYLLLFLGPNGPGGAIAELFGGRSLAFTFSGLVVGSIIYSLPFYLQPVVSGFQSLGHRPFEIAETLGVPNFTRFFRIALPLARPGILSGALLTFIHTLGEFGVVLMIGGSIPGETKVVSIAIYDHVESMEYTQAHFLSAGLVLLGVVFLLLIIFRRRQN